MSENDNGPDPKRLLERLQGVAHRKGAGPVTYDTVAEALGVTPNTVARWASGKIQPSDEEVVWRLGWIVSQAGRWYLKVFPAIMLGWSPGARLKESERAGHVIHDSDYFDQVLAIPHRQGSVIEYRLRLAVQLEYATFLAIGPDRNRISLSFSSRNPGGKSISFHHRMRIGRGRTLSLEEGDELTIFVHYAV